MSTWIQGNLRPNEKLLALVQPHWLWLFTPGRIFMYLITLGFGVIYAYYEWRTHELAVTDKRIVMKAGIISRKVREMKLNSVESIEVDQSIIGRLMNYGTVRVNGNGEDVMTLKTVGDPWSIQKAATP